MPIQIIRDPKTGEERRVFVSPAGIGTGATPKPKPKPQPAGGGFMGSFNDLNPAKQVMALGTGVSTFMQTGDLNKSIAAASREAAPKTDVGKAIQLPEQVRRGTVAGLQRAADDIRYEIDRQAKVRAKAEQWQARQSMAGSLLGGPFLKGGLEGGQFSPDLPSTGPGAPSAKNVPLPGWANYDNLRVEPQGLVEQGLAGFVEFLPYFVTGNVVTAPLMGAARALPMVGKVATRFEKFTGALRASEVGLSRAGIAGAGKKLAGVALEEAVSGAPASAFATYYTTQPGEGTTSDALMERVKDTPWEPIVAKGLLTNRNDTVEQARLKAAIDDLVWSIPLGGTVGTGFRGVGAGFRGVGAMREPTKRALSNLMHKSVQFVQAKAAAKNAVENPPAAAAAEPSVPSAGTPAAAPTPVAPTPKVVSGKRGFSSEAYQAMRRTPMWEKTGVEIQGRLEPQAGQAAQEVPADMRMPADSYAGRLNYSDINPAAGPLNANGKRYAEALSTQDADTISRTSQKLRASFKDTAERLGIELGPNAASQSWSMWDIGKQLYMDANPTKSNKPYVLGNPLTNIQVQADIVDRMLGFEMTKGVDAEGKRWKSWQLTAIGRKAREDAGIDLNLAPNPEAQRTVPAPAAPATPEAAAIELQQAQEELVTASQRLEAEAAREQVTVADPWFVPEGQLPGMNPPAYEQVGTIETSLVATAPKALQYKAEGRLSTTGRTGSLAEEEAYLSQYAGVITVWRDVEGELGAPGQLYVVNGHNRLDLANRFGAQFINVQYIEAPTSADARVVGALQNIKDEKGTAIDAAKVFRDTGMTPDDMRIQGVTLSGKLSSEGLAMSRLPQWLFDKAAMGELSTPRAVALGSAADVDEAIISDVAKQAIKGNWAPEKIAQAMQEAKFADTSAGGGGGIPGLEEMFKTTNVVDLIDIRTAAFTQLSAEMRALAAASKSKNTSYLEGAGNVIDVEGSQAARRTAAEAVAVFNRVAGYEGPVRAILNELAAQMPKGAGRNKAATNLVQFNLQRLRDAISEEMNGPRLIKEEAAISQLAEVIAPEVMPTEIMPKAKGTPISEAMGQDLNTLSQSLGRLTRAIDENFQAQQRSLQRREEALAQELGAAAPEATPAALPPATTYVDPLEVENLADARDALGLPPTANVVQVMRIAKQEGFDGITFTGEFGLPGGKKEIDLRGLPEDRPPENAGNPAPIQAKPADVAPVAAAPSPVSAEPPLPAYKVIDFVGLNRFELAFESSLDRIAYELAQGAKDERYTKANYARSIPYLEEMGYDTDPSEAAIKYLDWIEQNGLDAKAILEYGRNTVEPSVNKMVATAEPGIVQVRDQGFGKVNAPEGQLEPEDQAVLDELQAIADDLGASSRKYAQEAQRSLLEAADVVQSNLPVSDKIVPITPGFTAKAGGAKDENEAIAKALERLAAAEAVGNTEVADNLRTWLGRRNVSIADLFEQSAAAMAASDARLYRKAGESIGAMRQGLAELEGLNVPTPKLTKPQQEILRLVTNGEEILNESQRRPAIQKLLDLGLIDRTEIYDEQLGYATGYKYSLKEKDTDFSAELPEFKGWQRVEGGGSGTVGEGYTGATRITEREANELARIAFQITGITNFEIRKNIEVTYGVRQARALGDMSLVGQKGEIAGFYRHAKRMADDTIAVAMSAYGVPKTFTQMVTTTYHESMHRLMKWFFTPAEKLVLRLAEKDMREMAALLSESFGLSDKAAQLRSGKIQMREVIPDAFAAFMRGITLPKVDLQGFAKLKQYVDESINYMLSLGKYKTWDDVFEKAALGEFKARGDRDGGDVNVEFAADPPDPAEFARRIEQNMEALASGDLSPEEIARMGASDVRRLTSRSGNTQYVPDPPDTLVASNKALAEMLTSRGQATDISDASMTAINTAAFDQLYRDGWTVDSTVARLEAARRGDPRSQEDLIALAANLIHRDDLAAQNAMTAIEWQSAVDEVDRAAAMQRLWAGLESQHKLDTSLMTASRKDGQRLRVMQLRYDFDPTHRQVPTGTPLYHGNTEAAAQSIIDNGFQASGPKSNLLGSGVYFSETSVSAGAYGETAVAGDLPGDVRILDLVTMDKRIADLVQELNLGPLQRRGESLYTTPAQNRAIQDWAVGQGYSGIRFSPDFELGSGAAPETVIYDVNAANRIVGSNAAVEAEIPVTNERMGTDIEDEILNPINTILGKIDPDIRNAIAEGVMTAEANDITDAVAQAVISSRYVPGMAAKLNSIVGKADVGRLNQEMFLQAYRAALLWSPKTWTKMLVGSAYRAVTMPINQALGELAVAGVATLKGDNKAKAAALRQARIDMAMYGQIVANWSNAWRLVGESFRTGESFGNLGASSMDIAQRNLKGSNRDQMALMAEADEPANTLDNPWWYDPENANIPAHAAKYAWTVLNGSGRIAGSLDTFYSSLIGPSAEWGRIIGLELEKAENRGLTGDEAWAEASKKADEAIENQWSDVILNERIIKDGAFTGVHAENAMNWVNFTDPLKIDFQERTFEYGIAKAKEEGLTDVAEINRRAMAWMQEEPDGFAKAFMGTGQFIGALPRLAKDAISHTPALGMLNAFPTSPVNIAKSAARATGFLSPFVDSFMRDIYSEDRNTRARAIGEVSMGYLTLTAGVLLATSGWVEFSGPGSYDEKTREKMRRMGVQPYSVRVKNPKTGDTTRWWDLQAFDSVSNIFALVGTFVQKSNSLAKEDREAMGSNFILATMEMFREVGMAQATKDAYKSIGELFNLITDLSEKGFIPVRGQIDPFSAYVEKRMAGFMPAIFNNVRKGVDPYQRAIEKSELPVPIAQAHELAQRYANKIPGLSRLLPPVLHPLTAEPLLVEGVWGLNHLPQDQPWLLGLVNGLSPLAFTPTKQGTKDPVDIELGRLSGRGTMFQIWSQNEFNVPRYKLTQTQLNKLATITSELVPPGRNGTLHQELSAAVAPTSDYWQLDPPEPSKATQSSRAIRLNKAITYYKPFIKEAFLASEPELARILAENKAEQERNVIEEAQSSQSSWSPTPR